jgi:uncharacterized protein YcnI
MSSRMVRVAGAIGMIGGLVLAMALPASAHVTMHSYEGQAGGSDALISFRTPNEESSATTTQLEVDFPVATPLIGLYVEPTPGWQFQVTTSNLPAPVTNGDGTFTQYVSKVVWSGGNIPVGGYQDFNIDVSDLPNVPTIEVKALQTYSNGDIVRWIDDPATNPPHPAPTLALTPAPAAGGSTTTTAAGGPATTTAAGGPATTATPAASQPAAAPTVSLKGLAKTSDVNSAKTVSIIALIVGIVGLLAAAGALFMRRRPAGS